MNLIRTSPPAKLIVTLDEAKAHCRVDGDEENAHLTGLIAAATSWLDGRNGQLGRALITQTWEYRLTGFPSGREKIEIPLPPLQSVGGIAYTDVDGEAQTFDTAGLVVSTGAFLGCIRPGWDQTWPSARNDADTVTITFTAGYGAAEESVPQSLRHAALLLIGHWYENREAVQIGRIVSTQHMAVAALIDPFRVPFWAAEE